MAIIHGPLDMDVVQSMRGIVDFYYYRNQLVARAWPRKPRQPRSPRQLAHWAHLRRMHAYIKQNPEQWYNQIGLCSTSPRQSVDDRARYCAYRLTYNDIPPPLPEWQKLERRSNHQTAETTLSFTPITEHRERTHNLSIMTIPERYKYQRMRWVFLRMDCGRWNQQRELYGPPTDFAIEPFKTHRDNSTGTLSATFPINPQFVWAWPVYSDQINTFTAAAWLL